jgi:hypothetical protein
MEELNFWIGLSIISLCVPALVGLIGAIINEYKKQK